MHPFSLPRAELVLATPCSTDLLERESSSGPPCSACPAWGAGHAVVIATAEVPPQNVTFELEVLERGVDISLGSTQEVGLADTRV